MRLPMHPRFDSGRFLVVCLPFFAKSAKNNEVPKSDAEPARSKLPGKYGTSLNKPEQNQPRKRSPRITKSSLVIKKKKEDRAVNGEIQNDRYESYMPR